ncbi:hypothetical protein [Actinacidiphila glaucinigra]|uniref:DivIVA domain-containing protein n=1 Tax=Actinacidiphila glaucinigra TaxID=235986 RepID=UPI002E37F76B|nr:hypothetical protein [Actinacidiphila glaucinigra]
MNPEREQGHERHGRITMGTGAGKTHSFAAIMQRLKGRSADEQAQLRARADAAVLGHEAYALGHEHLSRGNYIAAKRWLRVAADHSVPGAEAALEEIDSGQVLDGGPASGAGADSATGVSCEPASAGGGVYVIVDETVQCNNEQPPWVALLERVYTSHIAADAKAEAKRVTERASREADEVLSRAREQMRQEQAEFQRSLEEHRQAIAEALAESEHVLSTAQQIHSKARDTADAVLKEAEQQAEAIIGDAFSTATRRREGTLRTEAAYAGHRELSCDAHGGDAEDWQLLLHAIREAYSGAWDQWSITAEGRNQIQIWNPLRQPVRPDSSRPGTAAVTRVGSIDESAAVRLPHPHGSGFRAPGWAVRVLVASEALDPGTPLSLTGRCELRELDDCAATPSEPHEGKGALLLWCWAPDREEDSENSPASTVPTGRQNEGVFTFRYIDVDRAGI